MNDALVGFASRNAVPRFRSAAPLAQLGLGPEEGFVLSRVDGATQLGDLLALVPFEPERTVAILRKLWLAGAIEIPGHEPPVLSATPVRSTATSSSIPRISEVPPNVDLTLEQIHQIETVFAQLRDKTAFELLGLQRGADKKDIKKAYFKLSKTFHPDRFYGKSLGGYADKLAQTFQAIKAAFELLSDDARREAYEESIFG